MQSALQSFSLLHAQLLHSSVISSTRRQGRIKSRLSFGLFWLQLSCRVRLCRSHCAHRTMWWCTPSCSVYRATCGKPCAAPGLHTPALEDPKQADVCKQVEVSTSMFDCHARRQCNSTGCAVTHKHVQSVAAVAQAHRSQHNAHCTMRTAHCTQHNAHCTMRNAHRTQHNAYCTTRNAYYIQHNNALQCIGTAGTPARSILDQQRSIMMLPGCQKRHIWFQRNFNLSTFRHYAMLKVPIYSTLCQRF